MTFEAWLQSRLVVHGHRIAVDGVIGPQTTGALRSFQRARKLKQSGLADAATVGALRMEPGKPRTEASTPPAELMPPWMTEMHRRMGLHETRDNAELSLWLRIGKYLGNPAKLPWCGDAIETCIVKTLPDEPVPNNPFWAQAWKDFGRAVEPIVGSIGVIRWSASSGHVGIVADATSSRILLLGGNQSNEINLTWFARSAFIAFRWPRTVVVKSYPRLTAAGVSTGTLSGTR